MAATHNSYAAADEPGWLFANQRFGIARQLRDGIRALLIDVHLGAPDPGSGRIRTDLEARGIGPQQGRARAQPRRAAHRRPRSSAARASAGRSAGAGRTSATRCASSGPSRSTSS